MDPRINGAGLGQTAKTIPALQLQAAAKGEKLNLCPCGCTEGQLDRHGYCAHLIGFTNDGRTFEPRIFNPSPSIEEKVDGAHAQDVEPTDILVPITSTSRVYRGLRVIKPEALSDTEALKQEVAELREALKKFAEKKALKPRKKQKRAAEPVTAEQV